MTIDPMAAVTTATSSVESSAAGTNAVTSTNATSAVQDGSELRVADQDTKVDLFDYSTQQQHKAPAIDTLQPESQAKYLSNPAVLGEKVLQRMESFHQRSLDHYNLANGATAPSAAPAASGEGVMSGPAAQHVAGSATPSTPDPLHGFQLMLDYAVETTMMTTTSSQFSKNVNSLMKGQ